MRFDFVVVGAGLAGCVIAERLASDGRQTVLLVDRRSHIGGNCFDCFNDDSILVHRYGPHILHTNDQEVIQYLLRFTELVPYYHRVMANVDGRLVPFPPNVNTINQLFGLQLSVSEFEQWLQAQPRSVTGCQNFEEVLISTVGDDLYKKFYEGYTRKQWKRDPRELDATIASRVPLRNSRDDRYFTDRYQFVPAGGYTRIFERMVESKLIKIMLNTDFCEISEELKFGSLVYTGAIDEFFGYKYGRLPYRSVRFVFRTLDVEFYQPVATVNYPNDFDFTRITEFKHITGQRTPKTTIVYEYPTEDGEPAYPVLTRASAELYERYQDEARRLRHVYFVGRLGTFRYLDMDEVVREALDFYGLLRSGVSGSSG